MSLAHLLLSLLVVLVWGFNFVVVKEGVDYIPPLLLAAARFFLTSIPAIFFVKKPATSWKLLICYSLVMFALQFAFLFLGIQSGVAPGLASILTQIQVFLTVLLGVLFFDERMHPLQIVGAVCICVGICFVAFELQGKTSILGFLYILGAALFFAIGNMVSKKIGRVNMIALVIWASFIAWPPLLGLSLWMEGTEHFVQTYANLTVSSVGAVLYIAYLATIFAYGGWSFLIHHHPLGVIAPFGVLVPVFALLSSVLLLGEPLETWKIGASMLILIGLCANVWGSRLLRKI